MSIPEENDKYRTNPARETVPLSCKKYFKNGFCNEANDNKNKSLFFNMCAHKMSTLLVSVPIVCNLYQQSDGNTILNMWIS